MHGQPVVHLKYLQQGSQILMRIQLHPRTPACIAGAHGLHELTCTQRPAQVRILSPIDGLIAKLESTVCDLIQLDPSPAPVCLGDVSRTALATISRA